MRAHAKDVGLNVIVGSAASSGWHSGEPADARGVVAARGFGLDTSVHRARILRPEDFAKWQLIIAMDHESLDEITLLKPDDANVEVTLIRRFASIPSNADVPDPYYTGRFDPVIKMFQDCMPGLTDYLKGAQ